MEEDIKILENIKEYMQNQINKGYHKFIYNDLGWDEKCIDVINAIQDIVARCKDSYHIGFIDGGIAKKYELQDKVKEKIEELKGKGTFDAVIVLQKLLED